MSALALLLRGTVPGGATTSGADSEFMNLLTSLQAPPADCDTELSPELLAATADTDSDSAAVADSAVASADSHQSIDSPVSTSLDQALLTLCALQWPGNQALPVAPAESLAVAATRDHTALDNAVVRETAGAAVNSAAGAPTKGRGSSGGAPLVPVAVTLAVNGPPTELNNNAPQDQKAAEQSPMPWLLDQRATPTIAGGPGVTFNSLLAFNVADATAAAAINTAATPSAAVSRTVNVPMHEPRWPEAIAHQVRWAVSEQVQAATLRLVPEQLGPVEMRVEVRDGQVSVSFSAAQAETRQALEQALPRLRELLAGAGLALGHASVQQESHGGSTASGELSAQKQLMDDEPIVTHARIGIGLVDEYA
jgi:flagellar hook-length control protein FliK